MKRLLAAAALSLTVASGCTPEVDFDVTIEGDATVQQGSLVETLLAQFGFESLVTFDLSESQAWQNNDIRKDQVTSTTLRQLRLSAAAPDGATLDFIDHIQFTAEAPNVEAAVVAAKDVAQGATEFDCDLLGVELAPYVRAETMTLSTDVSGRRPDVDTTVHVAATFHVVAKVIGQ